jgi:phosphoglycolate phosphatase
VLIGHVIFDLDGTLLDSRADLAAAVNHARHALGLAPLDPVTIHRYVGDGARALVERALGPTRRALWKEAIDRFLVYYDAHLLDRSCLYPGMRELLAALAAAGVSASVLTNKPEGFSRRILAGLGVAETFVDVIGGDTLPVRKPDPAGVAHLLARARVSAPRALVVGDSSVDVATARAAQVAFCGVSWGFNPDDILAADVPVVETAAALHRVVLDAW